jgi:hypothetical protein
MPTNDRRNEHDDLIERLKAQVFEQCLPRGQARDRQARAHREVDVPRERREVPCARTMVRLVVALIALT